MFQFVSKTLRHFIAGYHITVKPRLFSPKITAKIPAAMPAVIPAIIPAAVALCLGSMLLFSAYDQSHSFELVASARAEGLPELGEAAQSDFSPLMERRIGYALYQQMRATPEAYLDDPDVEDYLNALVRKLTRGVPSGSADFTAFGVRDNSLNAFAWPGGYIGVNSGTVLAAQSESELAGVLSHEMAHVAQHHIARMVSTQNRDSWVQIATLIVAVLAARSNPQASQAAIMGGSAAGIQNQLNFTRDFEREADRVGFQILENSGFDVRGMVGFFERLQKSVRLYENNAPAYLLTHPLTTERISDMDNRAQQRPYKQVADSIEFRLVRAKLAIDMEPRDVSMRTLEATARNARTKLDAAAWIGVGYGRLRARDVAGASEALTQLQRNSINASMVDHFAAEIQAAQGRWDDAIRLYQKSAQRFPAAHSLRYGLIDAQLQAHRAPDALNGATEQLKLYPRDDRLHELQARAYAQLGKIASQHRATAEAYALRGQLHEAVEQMEYAQRAKDGDFYESSRIDARLRELRQQLVDERKQQGLN